jgi:RimJ/RimL family protein N-acetyltransferase
VLTGKVVSLRAVEKEDAERVREWLSDPDLLHLLGARPIPLGALDPDKLPEMFRMREGRVLAIDSRDKQLVGLVVVGNFHEFNRTASILLLIGDRSEWNRGYGSDAVRTVTTFVFHDLNLNCLEAVIPEFNGRALKMFQKVGFQIEGTLRNRFFGRGRYWNMTVMSAVRDGWRGEAVQPSQVQAAVQPPAPPVEPIAVASRDVGPPDSRPIPIGEAPPPTGGSSF